MTNHNESSTPSSRVQRRGFIGISLRLLCVCVDRVVEEFYDDQERMCTDAIELSPSGPNVAINVPIGQWHSIRALESGTVVLAVKDGPYEPLGDEDILR